MSEPIDTGGSAFPVVIREELEIAGARRQVERVLSPGLSARDYFAAHAMAALIARSVCTGWVPVWLSLRMSVSGTPMSP